MPVFKPLMFRLQFPATRIAILFLPLFVAAAGPVGIASAFKNPPAVVQDQDDREAATQIEFVDTELPITHIVFFNTGIAQVIHAGTVTDNQSVKLDFPARTIDDVLKSLVFEDAGGGKVQSVQYQTAPGKEDLAARQMQPPLTVAQLLQKYRGEQVELTMANSRASGAIFGVENRLSGDDLVESVTLLIDERLQTFAIADVKSFRFQNDDLREQFEQAMTGLTHSRQTETKALELRFVGEGERQVRFAYIIDSPIWRMTYRLDADDESAKLQGWAHIDNVTTSDWQRVQIELRSGRARTFHADLFQPILGQRPSIGLSVFGVPPELRVLSDGWRDSGLDLIEDDKRPGAIGGFGGGGFGGGQGGGGGFGGGSVRLGLAAPAPSAELDIQSAVESIAEVGSVERMVTFRVKEPVDLAAGKSAMIPVIIDDIGASLLTVFDGLTTGAKPQLVLQIKNETDNAIVPGPSAVYRSGNFVGDAAMPRVELGDKAELNYGIDQPVSIAIQTLESTKKTASANFQSDSVSSTTKQTTVFEIKFTNKDSAPRDILWKMAIDGGVFEPQPETARDGMAHFLFQVDANSESTHTVNRVDTSTELLSLRKLSPSVLNEWKADGADIVGDLSNWLEKTAEIEDRRQRAAMALQELESVMSKATTEQERLLKLVAALEQNDAPRERFVGKLAELETVIEDVRPKIADAHKVLTDIHRAYDRHRESLGTTK